MVSLSLVHFLLDIWVHISDNNLGSTAVAVILSERSTPSQGCASDGRVSGGDKGAFLCF